MTKNIPELLSPAGDMQRLKSAILFGADAVYLAGNEFGMRTAAGNFSFEELEQAVEYAHSKNVKVYLTCNTVPRNDEIKRMPEFLSHAAKCGVDAFIICDIGVMKMAHEYAPDVDIHVSTQAGVCNYMAANEFYNMGAKRVVLARELSFEEIRGIRENTPAELEIEAFVHGSMCVSFSGRCLLSAYMTGRDANRGDCAQPCRWKYALAEENREGQYFPIDEDESGTHILNSRDMCMIEHIPELVAANITSFKIEGRAKSSYYVSVVTNAYRQAIDNFTANGNNFVLPDWIKDEMNKVSHREYSTGFYFGDEPGQVYKNGGYVRDYQVVAVVEDYKDGNLYLTQRNKFFKGDVLDVLEPGKRSFLLDADKIFNEFGDEIDSTPHPMMKLVIPYNKKIEKGALLRKKQ